MKHIIVTGHTGVGKSTLMKALHGQLDADLLDFDSPDFDSEHFPGGGVPDQQWTPRSGAAWRTAATGDWILRIKRANRRLILFGGILPDEFFNHDAGREILIRWVMLQASPEEIVTRLKERGGPVLEEKNVETWQSHIRLQVERQQGHRIFDGQRPPAEIASDFMKWANLS